MSAIDYIPANASLATLRRAVHLCRGCPLYQDATQAVFGEGARRARLILLGEQPGNQEDVEGKPFVGPAGQLLQKALTEAKAPHDEIYLTNVVKHFKHEVKGNRRLHKKPSAREVSACRPWFDAERAAISPEGIVCLGATAAQAILGRAFRIRKQRGEFQRPTPEAWVLATWHPSAILRTPRSADRDRMRQELIEDLKSAVAQLGPET